MRPAAFRRRRKAHDLPASTGADVLSPPPGASQGRHAGRSTGRPPGERPADGVLLNAEAQPEQFVVEFGRRDAGQPARVGMIDAIVRVKLDGKGQPQVARGQFRTPHDVVGNCQSHRRIPALLRPSEKRPEDRTRQPDRATSPAPPTAARDQLPYR